MTGKKKCKIVSAVLLAFLFMVSTAFAQKPIIIGRLFPLPSFMGGPLNGVSSSLLMKSTPRAV